VAVGRRHKDLDVTTDHLFRSVTEEPAARRVEHLDVPIGVYDDDAVHRRVDYRAQLAFAAAQVFFGLLALGNVARAGYKNAMAALACLAQRKLHRECGAVLAQPDYLALNPDHLP